MTSNVPSRPLKPTGSTPRGASFRDSLLRCPARFALAHYTKGIKLFPKGPPPPAQPLLIGIDVHEGLEATFKALQAGTKPPHQVFQTREAQNAFDQVLVNLPSWVRQGKILAVEKVRVVWVDDAGRIVPPPPDARERAKLAMRYPPEPYPSGPYPHTLRTDLEVEAPDGGVRIVDWKTAWTTSPSSKADKTLGFLGDLAFCGIDAAARRAYGDRYDGCYAILAPKAKEKRQRSGVLDVTPPLEARMRFGRTVAWSEEILRRWHGVDPFKWPAVLSEQGPCRDRYGSCPFFAPCRGAWHIT